MSIDGFFVVVVCRCCCFYWLKKMRIQRVFLRNFFLLTANTNWTKMFQCNLKNQPVLDTIECKFQTNQLNAMHRKWRNKRTNKWECTDKFHYVCSTCSIFYSVPLLIQPVTKAIQMSVYILLLLLCFDVTLSRFNWNLKRRATASPKAAAAATERPTELYM